MGVSHAFYGINACGIKNLHSILGILVFKQPTFKLRVANKSQLVFYFK